MPTATPLTVVSKGSVPFAIDQMGPPYIGVTVLAADGDRIAEAHRAVVIHDGLVEGTRPSLSTRFLNARAEDGVRFGLAPNLRYASFQLVRWASAQAGSPAST